MGEAAGPLTRWQGARYALLTLFLLAGIGLLAFLGYETRVQLDRLERAPNENAQYIYAQLEVEHLRLLEALAKAARSPYPDLDDVRTRFDILFSRADIVGIRRQSLEPELGDPLEQGVQEMLAFLNGLLPLIDSPDAVLAGALNRLRDEVQAAYPETRDLAQKALIIFAEAAEERREEVRRLVLLTSTLAVVLVLALALIVVVLLRVYQRAAALARDNAQARERLQATVGASQDAVLVMDTDFALMEVAGGAERIFGEDVAARLGEPMPEALLPEDQAATFRETLKARSEGRAGPGGLVELTARRTDGSLFPAEATLAAATGPRGQFFVCFLRDISERRRAEDARKEALDRAVKAEKAKSEFIAVMSHEMRTPLNGLMAALEILDEPRLTPKQKRYIGVARTTSQQLLAHVNDVLQISKLESGTFTPARETFSPAQFLQAVAAANEPLVEASGNRLVLATPTPPEGPVTGDRGRLNQILLNLLGNAAKFTRNGTITLGCEPRAQEGETLRLRFWVQDTGEGIAAEDLARIFEDFVTLDPAFQRESSGTGLGLSIARRLAQALGGEIGVESELGKGSTFWVDLPFERGAQDASGPVQAASLSPLPAPVDGAALEVLVVEDNAINRMIAREFIESTGAHVTEAADGLEGVQMAQEKRFDAIFMDIGMPQLDGMTATRRIRSGGASAEAPIFGLTAHAQPEDIASFLEAGMQDVLVKPVRRADIHALLGSSGPAQGEDDEDPADTLVNAQAIEELLQMLGEETLMGTFLRFAEETQAVLADLPEAPSPEIAPMLHRLAGSAGSFGALRFRHALLVAEGAAKEGHAGDYAEALAEVSAVWQDTTAAYAEIGLLLDDGF